MALVGNLKDLKLPNLIQLNCMEKNESKLTIEHSGKYGSIYFQNGQIVHAEFDPDIGKEALFRLLGLDDGKFKVEIAVRPPIVSITDNWSNLMLEGLHQFDTLHSSDTAKEKKIISMLLNVKGVKRAAFVTMDGDPLYAAFDDRESFRSAAFSIYEIDRISRLLHLDEVKLISLVINKIRVVLSKIGQDITYIEFDARHQLDTILPYVERILTGDA